MKDIFIVLKFTMKEMLTRKSYIISTLIILALIVIGCNVPKIINNVEGDEKSYKILVVDSKNIYEGTLNNLNDMDLGYDFEISNELLEFKDINDKIAKDEIEEAIIVNKQNDEINLTYVVSNASLMSGVPVEVQNIFTSLYSSLQISKLTLTEEELKSLTPNFVFELKQAGDKEASGNILAIMLLSIVLFYAIYYCAYQVSSSITTEKTSKIMETLVTSTSPKTIVLGKTIGIGLVGLIQLVLIILTAVISAKLFLEPGLIENVLDMSKITPFLGFITIIYFVLGYSVYALIYALTGSTVSKPEDIQSANGPVSLITIVGFYLSYFTMMNPTSNLNFLASILPISSPFCMPFRVMMGLADTKDIVISISILLITIFVVAKVAIKIYSNAILNYGTKMSVRDILNMYKEK